MISIIVALDKNRGIGKNNKIPWHIPEDLKHFKEITMGHPVIMGRKTFESIGRPLPDRTNIVVTRDVNFKAPGCTIVHSLDEAINKAKEIVEEIFIIGGAEIFRQSIDKADKLYVTIIDKEFDVDTYFPDYEQKFMKVAEVKQSNNDFSFQYIVLKRKNTYST